MVADGGRLSAGEQDIRPMPEDHLIEWMAYNLSLQVAGRLLGTPSRAVALSNSNFGNVWTKRYAIDLRSAAAAHSTPLSEDDTVSLTLSFPNTETQVQQEEHYQLSLVENVPEGCRSPEEIDLRVEHAIR